MINYLTHLAQQTREKQSKDFKRQMDTFIPDQEKRYCEIRKYEYMRVRNEVKRGLRSSVELLEWEMWRGF